MRHPSRLKAASHERQMVYRGWVLICYTLPSCLVFGIPAVMIILLIDHVEEAGFGLGFRVFDSASVFRALATGLGTQRFSV